MKTCVTCHLTKPLAEFGKNARYQDNLSRDCLDCSNAKARSRYVRRPEHYRAAKTNRRKPGSGQPYRRERYLRDTWGMSPESFEMHLRIQGGCCPICGGPGEAIDHDHATGDYRAILCHKCNRGLGHFNDDPNLLRKAVEYLEECAMMAADAGAVK